MINWRSNHYSIHQRGAATLFMSIILLVVITLIALYTSRSAMMDLVVSNNAYRSMQASEAAEAALNYGIAYYLKGGVDQDGNNVVDTVTVPTSAIGGKVATVQFCDPTSTLTTCTAPGANLGRIRILAEGYSDDKTAVHRATVLVSEQSAMTITPRAALTAKGSGAATLNGNLTITNNEGSTTIWTGTNIGAMTGSFQTVGQVETSPGTFVDDQLLSVKNGTQFYVGPDVVYNDASLKNMTTDNFFEGMTGRSRIDMAALANVTVTSASALPTATAANNYLGGQVIYVDASATPFSPGSQLGTQTKPVILIVDGEFQQGATDTVYGIVYCNNLTRANGSATIYGALIAEDVNVTGGGTFNLVYNSTVIGNAMKITTKSSVGNSWRDWE